MKLSLIGTRLKILKEGVTSGFMAGIALKSWGIASYINGSLQRGDSLEAAKELIEIANHIVEIEHTKLIDDGRAKEAGELDAEYSKIKHSQ